jgi:hypothetical protein
MCGSNAIECKGYCLQLIVQNPSTILELYIPNLIIQNISIDSEGLAIDVPA